MSAGSVTTFLGSACIGLLLGAVGAGCYDPCPEDPEMVTFGIFDILEMNIAVDVDTEARPLEAGAFASVEEDSVVLHFADRGGPEWEVTYEVTWHGLSY